MKLLEIVSPRGDNVESGVDEGGCSGHWKRLRDGVVVIVDDVVVAGVADGGGGGAAVTLALAQIIPRARSLLLVTIAEVHKAGGVAVYELLIAMTLLGMASFVAATTNMATTPPAATTTTKNLNK